MNKRIKTASLIIMITIAFCSCGKFNYDNYNSGKIIGENIDGCFYKINSKFLMFDDAGSSDDIIVKIDSSNKSTYKTADDYYNFGAIRYKAVFEKVYFNEDYIIITLKNNDKTVLINCKEEYGKKSVKTYECLKEIKLDLADFKAIECSYSK